MSLDSGSKMGLDGRHHDAAGNQVSLEDANGYTTAFAYDALNRLTGIDYPEPDADVSFTYDPAGNLVEMTDGVGTTEWEYDALSRPTSVIDPFDDAVGYEYDPLYRLTAADYDDETYYHYMLRLRSAQALRRGREPPDRGH